MKARPITAQVTTDLPGKDPGAFTYGETPDEIAADNYRRATFAAVAVKVFAETTGVADESPWLALSDLLVDLHHLADGLAAADPDAAEDWLSVLEHAEMHYQAEARGEL